VVDWGHVNRIMSSLGRTKLLSTLCFRAYLKPELRETSSMVEDTLKKILNSLNRDPR
jgi:hypothetical protein